MKIANLFLIILLQFGMVSCFDTAPKNNTLETKVQPQVMVSTPLNPVFNSWKSGVKITEEDINNFGFAKCFSYSKISDSVFSRMKDKSFPKNCTVSLDSLRYLKILHYNLQGEILTGEMVCNVKIAGELIQIFAELFKKKYPIEKIRLIDEYNADDELSMSDNNTSCFCFRNVSGSNDLSHHAFGMAIDINTLYNPYVRIKNGKEIIQPLSGKPYCDRNKDFDYKITKGDDCYNAFVSRGYLWGGDWKAYKDYQHFYKK